MAKCYPAPDEKPFVFFSIDSSKLGLLYLHSDGTSIHNAK